MKLWQLFSLSLPSRGIQWPLDMAAHETGAAPFIREAGSAAAGKDAAANEAEQNRGIRFGQSADSGHGSHSKGLVSAAASWQKNCLWSLCATVDAPGLHTKKLVANSACGPALETASESRLRALHRKHRTTARFLQSANSYPRCRPNNLPKRRAYSTSPFSLARADASDWLLFAAAADPTSNLKRRSDIYKKHARCRTFDQQIWAATRTSSADVDKRKILLFLALL